MLATSATPRVSRVSLISSVITLFYFVLLLRFSKTLFYYQLLFTLLYVYLFSFYCIDTPLIRASAIDVQYCTKYNGNCLFKNKQNNIVVSVNYGRAILNIKYDFNLEKKEKYYY